MWIILFCLLIYAKGVSHTDNCSVTKNISAVTGETFTLESNQEHVKDITLMHDNGKEIAMIEAGKLNISDDCYKDNLTSKGYSFQIKSTAEGQWKFTASVLYVNGIVCNIHFFVTVRDLRSCGEINHVSYLHTKPYVILNFNSHEVKHITWVAGANRTIAITQNKSKLEILDREYEGMLSVINVSLCTPIANEKDHGSFTASVLFHNGSQCLQHYSVTAQSFTWFDFLKSYTQTIFFFGVSSFEIFFIWILCSVLKNKRLLCLMKN